MNRLAKTLFALTLIPAWWGGGDPVVAAEKPTGSRQIPTLIEAAHRSQPGKNVVTIILPAEEAPQLFPADPKTRVKADFKAILTDGRKAFLGTIAPGGQSSLTVTTPNLRVEDLEEIALKGGAGKARRQAELAGVPIIDKTLRLNPMTMDDGYINTLTYLELLNRYRLIPASEQPLRGEYAKVVYRFVDPEDRLIPFKSPEGKAFERISAGLHLVNFNPVKYLKKLESDEFEILAVARSRYNVLNTVDRLKKRFGRSEPENAEELFSANDVRSAEVTPFRVEIKWVKKSAAEKERSGPEKGCENGQLLQRLLVHVYSCPKRFAGAELARELATNLDLGQLFRFMAINRLLENGDISDEFFWYVRQDKRSGESRLGIMPQDGDDMFTGAHLFPTNPKQIGLILKGGAVTRRLGLHYGYIMNYEDPLFRVVRDDPALFHAYLREFRSVAEDLSRAETLTKLFSGIEARIAPYSHDADILDRGRTDARGEEYTTDSFSAAVRRLQERIRTNAASALSSLDGNAGVPGDLEKARQAAEAGETARSGRGR